MSDSQARERIRNSLDESLIVEAAAGTGKTSELIHRIVNVIRTGRAVVDRIVAVTFTRKAAGELRLRLRVELDKARAEAIEAQDIRHLEQALSRLEEAHIGTIHAFCAELLRQRPVEAHIPPGFQEMDEQQSARLYNRAFDSWIQQALQTMPPGLRRALTRLSAGPQMEADGPPLHRLRWAGRSLIEWRDFPTPWRREAFDRESAINRLVVQIGEFARIVSTCTDMRNNLRRHLQPVVDFTSRLGRTEDIRPRDYDDVETLLIRLSRDLRRYHSKGPKKFSAQFSRDDVVDGYNGLLSNLEEFERRAGAELAALLQSEMRGLVDTYEDLKKRAGKLDFVDLLIRTRDLLRTDLSVRRFMQSRFSHIFVDEFQDTDPIQAEILMLLAADDPDHTDWQTIRPVSGKLFMVGDPKQSIYRFRRADIVMYQELAERMRQNGIGFENLTRSFRSVRPIQEAVNAAFATAMPDYVALEEFAVATNQPSVVALPAPFPYGVQRISKNAIDKCLPDTIAAFVDWLIRESGWTVRDPLAPERRVAIESRHIAILFRRFMTFGEDVTRNYVRALEVRAVPHVLWGARSFHHREEVETVRAALNAIEWPDDDLSMYAALRGSLFAIPDSLLFRHHELKGAEPSPEFEPIISALTFLRDLHRRRNRRSAVETVNELLEATRSHAGFALRPSGNQVLANVYRICDLARAYELSGGHSFRGFVEQLNAQAESEDSSEAPVLEDGAEGVRIMTVHAAKGLEFPIVILADMTANIAQRNPDKHVDGNRRLCAMRLLGCSPLDLLDHEVEERSLDEAEGVRIAYVAATRARDLLVVSAVGDEERQGWLEPLSKAIYPERRGFRATSAALHCPDFGTATVLKRPVEFDGGMETSVMPGAHRPQLGQHTVVWWDPGILRLNVEPSFGLIQEDILVEGDGVRAAESVARYNDWKESRKLMIETGAKASMNVFIATDAGDPPQGYAESVRVTRVSRSAFRPKGARFGALVHLAMRDVNYDGGVESIERIVATHARIVGATAEETGAAVHTIAGCLKHPLMDLARKSSRVYRELPVVAKMSDGPILDAVIDLAFEDDSGWIVVDFKTDAEDPARLNKYRRQVGWYVRGLEVILNQRPVGWLLHL